MITDQDVEKLKETFVTKADLKEELKGYARQESLDQLSLKVDGIQEEIGGIKVEISGINNRIDSLEGKFDVMSEKIESMDVKIESLDVKFDAMLGLLTDTIQEHAVGAVQYARHDRQIKALATATGTTLPD